MFEAYRRAHEVIAQGSLTNSKRVECLVKGITPTHATHGQGAWLYTHDKKKLMDFICALGTNLFGYAHPQITRAIQEQLNRGWLYSLGSMLEIEAAEKIREIIPFCSKVRFLKSGTEACMAAVRIARAHTGRNMVLSDGYHGWSDGFVGLTEPAHGVPREYHDLKTFDKLTDLSQIKDDVACVIIEPIVTDYSPARVQWIDDLIARCKQTGTLVIFDEIITGMRFPKYTFANESGRRPDIICLGKGIAAGLPLGVVGLGPGIGDKVEWFVSGSYAGECLSLVAMLKTLDMLRNTHKIADIWREGGYFLEKFNSHWPEKIRIEGYPTRGVFKGDPMTIAMFWQEAVKAGMLFGPSWWFNFAHLDYVATINSSCADIINRIRTGHVKLEGELPQTPFAQKVRNNGQS